LLIALLHIINLIAMKADQAETRSNSEKLDKTLKGVEDNPINAVNKLKSINENIEIMKNRYLVLRRRDEHNKYKTLDQQKKLSLHHMIHDRLKNEREELRKSLEEIRDTK
jgi:phage shock protein A